MDLAGQRGGGRRRGIDVRASTDPRSADDEAELLRGARPGEELIVASVLAPDVLGTRTTIVEVIPGADWWGGATSRCFRVPSTLEGSDSRLDGSGRRVRHRPRMARASSTPRCMYGEDDFTLGAP